MLSIEKKFLFIHVPKTGGNSIQNILRQYSEDDIITTASHQDGFERFEVKNKKYHISKHSTLSDYKRELEPELYNRLFKFAIIRNPWDMMISFYFSPHRNVNKWDRKKFKKLLDNVKPLRNYICTYSLTDKIISNLSFHDSLKKKKPLTKEIDFLLRFEYLENDFQELCNHLNIPFKSLPKRNRSERKHYSYYYDDDKELIEMVRNKFIEEIYYGNYKF